MGLNLTAAGLAVIGLGAALAGSYQLGRSAAPAAAVAAAAPAAVAASGPQTQDSFDLFPELATSLFCWVERLYRTLVEQGVESGFGLGTGNEHRLRPRDGL